MCENEVVGKKIGDMILRYSPHFSLSLSSLKGVPPVIILAKTIHYQRCAADKLAMRVH